MQVQRLLRLRRLTDWSPVIVVAILSSDQLHLALILATALSVGNILADLIFRLCGYIKVRLHDMQEMRRHLVSSPVHIPIAWAPSEQIRSPSFPRALPAGRAFTAAWPLLSGIVLQQTH